MAFVGRFQLSVTRALRDQLLESLDRLEEVPLNDLALTQVEESAGVYQLFLNSNLVYVGKADSNLRSRLRQHQRKLSGRTGDLLASTRFKCVYVSEDLDAIAPETMLIAHYRGRSEAAWNFNGFGNKDPGRNRDRSLVKAGHFDSLYPIDLDQGVPFSIETEEQLMTAMTRLKSVVPFVFRFESIPAALTVEADESSSGTFREWIERIGARLPKDWSIVALPGYVIAYRDLHASDFRSRIGAWSTGADGIWQWQAHQPEFDSTSAVSSTESVIESEN